MSAADDRAVIAALRAGKVGAAAVREASGLKAPAFKAAVQRLRYQGKVQWDALQLTASMIETQDAASVPPNPTPEPAAPALCVAGNGEDAGATAPSAPASGDPVPVRLPSAAEQLLRDIEAWCARTGTPEIKLGLVALRHSGFVALLRKRLTATPDTIAKVRAVLAAHPDGMAEVPMPANNICVPKGPKSESAARAIAAKAVGQLVRRGVSTLAEEVRQEAEAAAARRKASRMISGLAGAKLALLSDPTPAEMVTTALAETVDDAAKAMARRWPRTWAKVLVAARVADERPGQTLIRLLELGLAQVEARPVADLDGKPIIFSAPMVRALLDGRKTQTRRLLTKPLPPADASGVRAWFAPPDVPTKGIPNQWAESGLWAFRNSDEEDPENACGGYNRYCGPLPFRPGDRAYVREAHLIRRAIPCLPHEMDWQSLSGPVVHYLADGGELRHEGDRRTGRGIYHGPVEKARPSIHMPRWASRLTLFVEAVRVQRLQDISEADAIAEGISEHPCEGPHRGPDATYWTAERGSKDYLGRTTPIAAYGALWDSLHTDPGTRWEDNPWIYALTFRVNRGNVDHLETTA